MHVCSCVCVRGTCAHVLRRRAHTFLIDSVCFSWLGLWNIGDDLMFVIDSVYFSWPGLWERMHNLWWSYLCFGICVFFQAWAMKKRRRNLWWPHSCHRCCLIFLAWLWKQRQNVWRLDICHKINLLLLAWTMEKVDTVYDDQMFVIESDYFLALIMKHNTESMATYILS